MDKEKMYKENTEKFSQVVKPYLVGELRVWRKQVGETVTRSESFRTNTEGKSSVDEGKTASRHVHCSPNPHTNWNHLCSSCLFRSIYLTDGIFV